MYSMLVVMLALMGPVQLSLAGAVPHGRVRSLAYSSAATANHSGNHQTLRSSQIMISITNICDTGTKMLMADSLPAADLANQLLRRQWKPPTTTTTPSATVSIETLPGRQLHQ